MARISKGARPDGRRELTSKHSKTKPKTPDLAGYNGAGNLERLETILHLMERHKVAELEWEIGDERLRLCTQVAVAQTSVPQTIHQAPSPVTTVALTAPAPTPNQKQITSPFVGTFYRSPSPTAQPYVQENQSIKRGDVLCIIEAMKLMNEIEAEFSGKIVSIVVENGQPVEFGEPLFIVEV